MHWMATSTRFGGPYPMSGPKPLTVSNNPGRPQASLPDACAGEHRAWYSVPITIQHSFRTDTWQSSNLGSLMYMAASQRISPRGYIHSLGPHL